MYGANQWKVLILRVANTLDDSQNKYANLSYRPKGLRNLCTY